MSYARWGPTSDVYVYASAGGGVVCCGCSLALGAVVRIPTAKRMAVHLQAHVNAGHMVPPTTIKQVLDDAAFIDANGQERARMS